MSLGIAHQKKEIKLGIHTYIYIYIYVCVCVCVCVCVYVCVCVAYTRLYYSSTPSHTSVGRR